MDLPVEVVVGVGIFLGCFARAMFPFFRKKAEAAERGEAIRWEGRYLWTIIFAFFVSFVTTMMLLPGFQIPSGFVFPAAFLEGWAVQDIVNKVAK